MEDTQDPTSGEAVETAEPQTEGNQTANELAELKAKMEEQSKRFEDAQRKISEIANENATLQARINDTKPVQEQPIIDADLQQQLREASEIMQLDPEQGHLKMAAVMEATAQRSRRMAAQDSQRVAAESSEINALVTRLRKENPEIVPHENLIEARAIQKVNFERKPYKVAIEEAVVEFKKMREDLLKAHTSASPAPKGASGETGSAGQAPRIERADNEPPPDSGESHADYVRERKKLFAQKNRGL